MARSRETKQLTDTRRGQFALSRVTSEETLLPIREHLLSLTVPHTAKDGTVTQRPYETVLWEKLARKATQGHRDALRLVTRVLYGWVEKDSDFERKLAEALGVSLDVARHAVQLLQQTEARDPHAAAVSASQMLLWYCRTQRPIDAEVRDAVAQCFAACQRGAEVVVGGASEGHADADAPDLT